MTAAVNMLLSDYEREIYEFSKLQESDGLESIRSALRTLGRRQETLLRMNNLHRQENALDKLSEGERLLDKLIEQIARLIDMASAMAQKTPGAFTKAVATPTLPDTPPPRSGEHKKDKDKEHRHRSSTSSSSKHKHDKRSKEQQKPAAAAAPVVPFVSVAAPPAHMPAHQQQPVVAAAFAPAGADAAQQQQQQQWSQPSEASRTILAGPPEIPPEEIVFDPDKDFIGGGAFGKVYRAKCRGKLVAVKVPNKQDLTEQQLRMFRHEVTIMRKIFHPNVVLYLGACTKPGKLMIVTELMKCDMEHMIHGENRPTLTLHQKLRMAHDAALGINWLHGICQIIHRDLKPANLLLDEQRRVKVTDFGFSEVLKDGHGRDARGPKGTALYMAPEVMKLEEFDHRSDVYSYGLILYELVTGDEPFAEYQDIDPFVQAVCYKHERPRVSDPRLPPSLLSLMERCWHRDVERRPSFQQIIADLEEIMVDAVIEDTPARAFWKRWFLRPQLQEQVSWPEFEQLLAREHGVAPLQISPLQQFFTSPAGGVEGNARVVTMERFDLLYTWFGNFFEAGPEGQGTRLLRDIVGLVRADWFHDDVAKDLSESRLRQRSELTFLIRASHTDAAKTPFTISKVRNGCPVHKRIQRLTYEASSPSKFCVLGESERFSSLAELVDKLRTTGSLGVPCEKSVLPNPYL
eukprot:m51a1_g4517 putative sh2 domain-containing protein (688) ;mRNA; f:422969-426165